MMKRFLISFLVAVLTIEGPLAMAGSSEAARPTVIVIALHQSSQYSQETRDIADALRKKLSKNNAVEVISRTRTEEIVSQVENPAIGTQVHDLLKKAKEFYLEFEMSKARSTAQRALSVAEIQVQKTGNTQELLETHLTLGLIDIAENKKDSAHTHFKKVLFFQPHRVFTENEYSSRVLEVLKQVKNESDQSETGNLEITTDPTEAEIYVDGIHRGQSPLKVKLLPAGTHYLKAIRTADGSVVSKVEVISQKEPQKMELKLEKLSGKERAPYEFHSKSIQSLRPKLQQVVSLSEVQKVVLVSLNPEKSFGEVTMSVYDQDSRQITSFQEALPDVKKFKSPVSKLANSFTSELTAQIAQKNLKKETTAKQEPYIPYQKVHDKEGNSKTPLYKKPGFWVVVGILLAGAGAGSYFGLMKKGGSSSVSGASASQSPNNGVIVNVPAP